MKQLALIALLMGSTAQAITVESGDGHQYQIADDVAMLSEVLRDAVARKTDKIMLTEVKNYPLKRIIGSMKSLKKLQDKYVDARKWVLIKEIKFEGAVAARQLVDLLKAASYLKIDLLMDAAAWQLAEVLTLRGSNATRLFTDLPDKNLQELVAKHYVIRYLRPLANITFTPSVSIDDLLEYGKAQLIPRSDILYLGGRYLTSAQGLEKLAQKYPNLKSLILSHNQLTELPDSIGKFEQLESLGLANNKLVALPKSIGRLKKLISLDLDGNQMSPHAREDIEKALPNTIIFF